MVSLLSCRFFLLNLIKTCSLKATDGGMAGVVRTMEFGVSFSNPKLDQNCKMFEGDRWWYGWSGRGRWRRHPEVPVLPSHQVPSTSTCCHRVSHLSCFPLIVFPTSTSHFSNSQHCHCASLSPGAFFRKSKCQHCHCVST